MVPGRLLSYTDHRAACFRASFLKNTLDVQPRVSPALNDLCPHGLGAHVSEGPSPQGSPCVPVPSPRGRSPLGTGALPSCPSPRREGRRAAGSWGVGPGAQSSPAAPERRSLGAFARRINPSGPGTGGARAVPGERAGRGETGPDGLCGPCTECTGQVSGENDHVFM